MIWNQEKQRVGWLPDAEPSLDGEGGGRMGKGYGAYEFGGSEEF